MDNFFKVPPSSAWPALFQISIGVLVGWLASPSVWLVAGPFRMLAMQLASSGQESGWSPTVCGDGGISCGPFQFQVPTIESIGGTAEDRYSYFWSGYYSVRMVARALAENWRWWSIGIPIYGYAVVRYLWVHGWGDSAGDKVFERAWARKGYGGAMPDGYVEAHAWPYFFFFRGLTLLLGTLPFMALIYMHPRLRMKVKGL